MRLLTFAAFACGTVPLLGACHRLTVPRDAELRAHISGARSTVYRGSATFSVSRQPDADQAVFELISIGAEDSQGQRLSLQRFGGPPRAGSHQLGLLTSDGQTLSGFSATYIDEGEVSEYYVSSEGEVNVTESTDSRFVATFVFRAIRYCRLLTSGPEQEGSCTPLVTRSGDPEITVEGSVAAVPTGPGIHTR